MSKSLTAIALTDGVQDFANANTTDFFKLLRVRLVRTDTTPDEYNDKITIRDFLPPDLTKSSMWNIQSVSYDWINSKIRLERAIAIGSGETLQIQGEYWKTPTTITGSTLDTAFAFQDHHFDVFVDGLKWAFYDFIGDSRAGTAQVTRDGRRLYTGQLGVFMDALQSMASAEDYGDEGSEYPDEPMGNRESGGVGLWR